MNVSIIIPAYNAEATLGETLESVLAQTHAGWEAIVVNDGSTDRTADIAKRYEKRDSRIRPMTQANAGEAGARNAGLGKAQHEWILFLDADDRITPTYLERMTSTLEGDPSLDAVVCGSARIAADGTLLIESYLPPDGDIFPVLARRAAFPVHACVVRRSLVESVGRFDPSLRTCPDWDLWQRVARTGARFGTIPDAMALYRMSPHSASMNAQQILKDGLRVIRQGHAPDSRVPNPHPSHANGEPSEQIRTQVFYLLSWCAGVLLGQGKDPRPLLEYVQGETFPELYPEAVAQCLFDSANLPSCKAPHAWEDLWPALFERTMMFLSALEVASTTPNLARRAGLCLKKKILSHSRMWQPLVEELEEIKRLLTEQCESWQRIAEDRARSIEQHRETIEQQRTTSERQETTIHELERTIEQQRTSADEFGKNIEDLTAQLTRANQQVHELERRLEATYQEFWVRVGLHIRLVQDRRLLGSQDLNNI